MKKIKFHFPITFVISLVIFLIAQTASAQDATVVDAKHYKVEFENEYVRVLRVKYGPGEKSVMHEHPANVAVFLNDNKVKFTLPDGKSIEVETKAGQTLYGNYEKHLPQNIGNESLELILVELKKVPK